MKTKISLRRSKQGLAFSDYLGFGDKPSQKHFLNSDSNFSLHRHFMLFCLFIFLGAIFVKVISLQILNGSYYRNLSNNNRIKTIMIRAPRGIIFDRNGAPLVYNIPGFREMVNGKTELINHEQAIKLIAKGKKDLEVDSLRQYPNAESTAHILGYVGQISKEELNNPLYSNYMPEDLIGKNGVEKSYEKKLKGVDGKQLIEVNAYGEKVRTLGQVDPIPGENIYLTIDTNLQKTIYAAMEKVNKGAAIVSTPKGEILAMVSKPSFDPNLFTMGEGYHSNGSYQNVSQILTDSDNQPLLNHAISGTYPPGSTFKIIPAIAGLQDNIIDENYEITDNGVLQIGQFSFANWYFTQYGRTEGSINIVRAITRSNDIFFYKLAELIGIEKISQMADKLDIGKKTGIDLDGEEKGLLPTETWKKKTIGEQWYLGDTYHYGIGQGFLLTTPLQVNTWTQALINKGAIYTPHLLKNSNPVKSGSSFLSDKNVELIREGMIGACSDGGVAWPLFNFMVKNDKLKADGKDITELFDATHSASMKKVSIACKTGTAEHGGEKTLPHAWITLFAPAYNPQIIITVLAESSGEGSNIAAPIAKEILNEWFTR